MLREGERRLVIAPRIAAALPAADALVHMLAPSQVSTARDAPVRGGLAEIRSRVLERVRRVPQRRGPGERAGLPLLLTGLAIRQLPSRVCMASMTRRLVDEVENHPAQVLALTPAVEIG